MPFDRAHTYQFVVFFDPARDGKLDVDGVAAKLTEPSGAASLGLKTLGSPTVEQALVSTAGSPLVPTETVTWNSGVWRATLNRLRLDVHFDALGFANISDQNVTLAQARIRLASNLATIPSVTGLAANRLALVVSGLRNVDTGALMPSQIVARSMLAQRYSSQADASEILDANARVNTVCDWSLEGVANPLTINRIESTAANWAWRDGKEDRWLGWQADANISQRHEALSLTPASVADFFGQAASWIEGRLAEFEKIR